MSIFKRKVTGVHVPKSGKLVLLTLALMFIVVLGTAAQEPTSTPDLPDYEVVSVEVGPNSVTTTTVNIFANRDTFVSSQQPNSNFGGLSDFRVGRQDPSFGALRTLLQFDLSPIPSNSHISNATLNIFQSGFTPSNDPPYTLQARFLASDWSEFAVTWNNHQPSWGDVIGTVDSAAGVGWRVLNVNNMVQQWVNGRPNFGLVLQGSNEAAPRSRVYASRETVNRPFITVTFVQDTCAPSASVNSLPTWSPASFTVSWSGSDCGSGGNPPSGIRNFDVQSSLDGGNWSDWRMNTTDTSSGFSNTINGQTYFFRVRARDNAGNTGPWGTVRSTRVDSAPPVNPIITVTTIGGSGNAFPNFPVNWSATDALSGIQSYEVQAHNNQGGNWVSDTFPGNITGENFPGGTVGFTYSLQVRARDNVGNVSAWSPIINVTIVNNPSSAVLPFSNPITSNTSFQVQWLGFSTNPINTFTIFYRVSPSTTWIQWGIYNGSTTFDTFDVTNEINGYANETILVEFQSRATANNSPAEPARPTADASIVVDPNGNMDNNTVYMPVIAR